MDKFVYKNGISKETAGKGFQKCQKQDLTFSKLFQFEYDSNCPVELITRPPIDDTGKHNFILKKKIFSVSITTQEVYADEIPINEKKIKDVNEVGQNISDEYDNFYKELLEWPTTEAVEDFSHK